jgi:hypothetical protein
MPQRNLIRKFALNSCGHRRLPTTMPRATSPLRIGGLCSREHDGRFIGVLLAQLQKRDTRTRRNGGVADR